MLYVLMTQNIILSLYFRSKFYQNNFYTKDLIVDYYGQFKDIR